MRRGLITRGCNSNVSPSQESWTHCAPAACPGRVIPVGAGGDFKTGARFHVPSMAGNFISLRREDLPA